MVNDNVWCIFHLLFLTFLFWAQSVRKRSKAKNRIKKNKKKTVDGIRNG